MTVTACANRTRSDARTPSTYSPAVNLLVRSDGTRLFQERANDLLGGQRDYCSRTEDASDTRGIELIVILRWNPSSTDYQDVLAPEFLQLGNYFRHECVVASGEGRDPEDVNVVFGSHAR